MKIGGFEVIAVHMYNYHIHMIFSVNDTLDDILGESGDEEESDAVVNQVLDEIGIEITGKVTVF